MKGKIMLIAKNHQKRIAQSTLKMTPAGARIMGGMDYPTAYKLIFSIDLISRIKSLVSEYGDKSSLPFEDGGVNWELSRYGYTPAELLNLLGE